MMSRLLIILSYVLYISSAKPADTCDQQDVCLDVTKEALRNGREYKVCITFNTARPGCNKFDTISHSCYSGVEKEKIDGWRNGDKDKMCRIVKCEEEAQFGVKDGKGCRKTNPMRGLKRPGITDIRCEFTGGYCGGGNKEDCTWSVPTPKCPSGSCPDGSNPTPCVDDPCQVNKCAAYPDAQCTADYCGGCNAIFSVDGQVLTDAQCNPPGCPEDLKRCPDGTKIQREGKHCVFPECPPPVAPPCTPEGATFIGDNTFCAKALFPCGPGFRYWNKANCGCGCEPDPSAGSCLVGDVIISDGELNGYIGRTCTSETLFDGTQSRCVKGEMIEEPYKGDCSTVGEGFKCCQSGKPGDYGAAICITRECNAYQAPTTTAEPVACADDVDNCCDGSTVSRDPDNNCQFRSCKIKPFTCVPDHCSSTPCNADETCTATNCGSCGYECNTIVCPEGTQSCPDGSSVSRDPANNCEFRACPFRDLCRLPMGAVQFVDFKENCDPNMDCSYYGGGQYMSDDCGCFCGYPSVYAHSAGLQVVDHNVDGYNGWSDWQFLVLNAAVSVVTCLLVIAVCLTGYYLVKRCNGKKYQVLKEDDVEDKI